LMGAFKKMPLKNAGISQVHFSVLQLLCLLSFNPVEAEVEVEQREYCTKAEWEKKQADLMQNALE